MSQFLFSVYNTEIIIFIRIVTTHIVIQHIASSSSVTWYIFHPVLNSTAFSSKLITDLPIWVQVTFISRKILFLECISHGYLYFLLYYLGTSESEVISSAQIFFSNLIFFFKLRIPIRRYDFHGDIYVYGLKKN